VTLAGAEIHRRQDFSEDRHPDNGSYRDQAPDRGGRTERVDTMSDVPDLAVRRAEPSDAEAVARLLHDFNSEYDDFTPGPTVLAERVRELLAAGEITVLLGGSGPHGLAVLRFRPSFWTGALDCYLEELYVVPARRGQGLGRALMEAAIDLARREGATHMDLGTSEDDVAARSLYESLGFDNHEGKPDGPISYFYEREL
jgi:GNAT superfamily N-acetyltransferase